MINILTVGKTKNNFISDAIWEYEKRVNIYGKINSIVIPDVKLTSTNNIKIVKDKEADRILEVLKKFKQPKFLLDEKGKQYSSVEFAEMLNKHSFNAVFIIGGVYGISDKVKKNCDYIISFSKMTFTHQMIRVFLLEQIYRAFTIIKGKKYHY